MSGSASAATTPTTPKFFMIKKTPLGPIIFNDLFSETRELEKKLITKSGTTMSEKAIYRKLVRDDGLMGPKKDRYAVFLLFALKNGLSLLAETILKEPSTDLKREDLGCTALHYAVSSKKIPLSIIKILLERQPSIKNRRDSDGQTALFSAISDQYTKIAKLLLHFGANPNISNRNEVTPLFMAAFDGDLEMVKLLLKHKAVIVGTPSLSPLLCAIEGGHVSIVRELLDAGANPSIQMDTGETPMRIALKEGNKEMIKLLFKPCLPFFEPYDINFLMEYFFNYMYKIVCKRVIIINHNYFHVYSFYRPFICENHEKS